MFDSSKIFYHNRYIYYDCGTGVDFTKPPNILLTPNNLVEIKINDLQNFLLRNVSDTMVQSQYVTASISSPSDTIRNKSYKIITNFFKDKKIRRYVIRNWTEEEHFVAMAKIQNKQYDPSKVDWRIGFDTKFIPPKDTI